MLTAISDGMVALLKEFYGRGPTRTKSYYQDDLVVCVLRGGFSRVEQTLLDGGRGEAVIQQRMEFQEVMRERFEEVIEHATGRRVIGFMSGNQQHPDMMCEVFVLGPTDLVDERELPADPADRPARTRHRRRLDRAEYLKWWRAFTVGSAESPAARRDFQGISTDLGGAVPTPESIARRAATSTPHSSARRRVEEWTRPG